MQFAGGHSLGGLSLSRALQGFAGGRLERTSSTTLDLTRTAGALTEVHGGLVPIPAAGLQLDISSYMIDSDGEEVAVAPAASTMYYTYLSNLKASYRPGGLAMSLQAPTLADDGFLYLGASGNALEWRFLGWVFLSSAVQFTDNPVNRHVVNYYNRQLRHLRAFPGYSDDSANSVVAVPIGTSFELAHADGQVSWIANGEDSERVCLVVAQASASGAANPRAGIGINSVTSAEIAHTLVTSANDYHYTLNWVEKGTAGEVQTASFLSVSGTAAWTYYADLARAGSAADPHATILSAMVST